MTMKYGRRARRHDPRIPHRNALPVTAVGGYPVQIDYAEGMPANLGMMLNDTLGDCTAAGCGHATQVWTFMAQSAMVTPTDAEVEALYEATGGYVPGKPATDQGADEQTVLTHWLGNAFGHSELAAFYELDVKNPAQLYEAVYECGVVYIGFNVPAYLQNLEAPGSMWDEDPTKDNSIVGGHCVIVTGYDTGTGDIKIKSWGSTYTMTAEFWNLFVDEAYALVDAEWVKITGNTPAGLPLPQLVSLMKELTMSPSPAPKDALIPVTVSLAVATAPLPAANAAQASISVVVTDSSGVAQGAVSLNGTESPTPWAFSASIAPGAGTVVATALDTAGAAIGDPLSASYNVTPQATYQAPSAITVTPLTSSLAAAAAHVAAARA